MTLKRIEHQISHADLGRSCWPAASARAADHVCLVERLRWRDLPLCQRYFYAAFGTLPVQTEQEPVRPKVLIWARGYVADGGSELLGLWQMQESDTPDWRELGEDLRRRGLVNIVFGLTDAFGFSRSDLAAIHESATATPSSERLRRSSAQGYLHESSGRVAVLDAITAADTAQGVVAELNAWQDGCLEFTHQDLAETWQAALRERQPFHRLAPRFRRLIRTWEAEARLLHQRLVRSVTRHGAFADGEAAVVFVGRVLDRAQRELDARQDSLGSLVARSLPRRDVNAAHSASPTLACGD